MDSGIMSRLHADVHPQGRVRILIQLGALPVMATVRFAIRTLE